MSGADTRSRKRPGGLTRVAKIPALQQPTVFAGIQRTICVIAAALIGALIRTGGLPLRQGTQVVLGCFVLFGAPIIAEGLLD